LWRESVSHINGSKPVGSVDATDPALASALRGDPFFTPSSYKTNASSVQSAAGCDSPASVSTTTASSSDEDVRTSVVRPQVVLTSARPTAPQLQTCGSTFSIPPSRTASGFGDLSISASGKWACQDPNATDRGRPAVDSRETVRSASAPSISRIGSVTPGQCLGRAAVQEQKKALAEKMVGELDLFFFALPAPFAVWPARGSCTSQPTGTLAHLSPLAFATLISAFVRCWGSCTVT
jgi:hypothetical protein